MAKIIIKIGYITKQEIHHKKNFTLNAHFDGKVLIQNCKDHCWTLVIWVGTNYQMNTSLMIPKQYTDRHYNSVNKRHQIQYDHILKCIRAQSSVYISQ